MRRNIDRLWSYHPLIKAAVIGWFFLSVLSDYVRTGNFNDDKYPRPVFHGAYDIPVFVKNGDTLPPLLTDTVRWRRVFVHRRGYLIMQSMNDDMQDYLFTIDTMNNYWRLERTDTGERILFDYKKQGDSVLYLDSGSMHMELRKIDLSKLPVMRKEFNWTID